MAQGKHARRIAELHEEVMTASGLERTTDLDVLRTRRQERQDTIRRIEQEVESDIAHRRFVYRVLEARKFNNLFADPPRRSDMTYWKTRIGEPVTFRIPEEQKGKRDKTTKYRRFDMNKYRTHALEGFVYWIRRSRDQTLRLARAKSPVRTDKLAFKSANSLGSMRPDWRTVQY